MTEDRTVDDAKARKRASYAQAYGAGAITVARLVGQYPPPDLVSERTSKEIAGWERSLKAPIN